jgi:MFS superfamily sulfate permease-like transporter
LPVVYLWYKFKKQADNLGDWYIDKTALLILSPFIIFVTAYSYAATEGSNLKIVLIATLNAILISMLFSLNKPYGNMSRLKGQNI